MIDREHDVQGHEVVGGEERFAWSQRGPAHRPGGDRDVATSNRDTRLAGTTARRLRWRLHTVGNAWHALQLAALTHGYLLPPLRGALRGMAARY